MIGRSQKEEALKVRVVKASESSEKEKVICYDIDALLVFPLRNYWIKMIG